MIKMQITAEGAEKCFLNARATQLFVLRSECFGSEKVLEITET
jgi:hypothetical protein